MESFCGKVLVDIFGGNAVLDILKRPAFKKYSIYWVFEAFYICLCLCVFLYVFVLVFLIITRSFQKIFVLYGLEPH